MKFTSWITIFATLMCLVFTTGCLGGADTSSGGGDLPSNDGTGDEGMSVEDFYIGVGNGSKIRSHVRTAGSFGTTCSIASGATNQDLNCIIDVPEGDLYFHGMNIRYNIPSGMCRYLTRQTYWYYNQEVGVGPATVRLNTTINNNGDFLGNTCSINGGAAAACNAHAEVVVDGTAKTATCAYDLTKAEKSNCCLGEYTFIDAITNVDTSTTSITSTQLAWGGDRKSCVGGAGRTNWEHYSKSGLPIGVMESAFDGIAANYEISAPINTANDGWNLTVANYSTPALHAHDGYVSAATSNLPYFIEPIDDRSGDLLTTTNVPYSFSCLNEAFEIQNRINVYVREWDVYTDYLAYIASSGVTEVPDRPGDTESVDCDGVTGFCNDRWDLDDFINEYLGGPYDTATPANRRVNFPENTY